MTMTKRRYYFQRKHIRSSRDRRQEMKLGACTHAPTFESVTCALTKSQNTYYNIVTYSCIALAITHTFIIYGILRRTLSLCMRPMILVMLVFIHVFAESYYRWPRSIVSVYYVMSCPPYVVSWCPRRHTRLTVSSDLAGISEKRNKSRR